MSENDNTTDAGAMPPASDGSVAGDRPAWALVHENERLRDEILLLRLTDAEREVLGWAIEVSDSLAECGATGTGGKESHESSTLRGLLERLG